MQEREGKRSNNESGDEMGAMGRELRVRIGRASRVRMPMAGTWDGEIVWSFLLYVQGVQNAKPSLAKYLMTL